MTDEEITAMARGIVIDDISDQIHDRMGLAEQLEDFLDTDGGAALPGRLADALTAIRDELTARWNG
jgi:hypothetical protein